jgi:hypothetical protein
MLSRKADGGGAILSRVRGLGEFEDTGRCLSTRAAISFINLLSFIF